VYLSVDNVADSGDLIQQLVSNVSALAPGDSYEGKFSFTIGTTVAGPFNIIVKANDDAAHQLLETNLANNTKSIPIQINVPQTADLQIDKDQIGNESFNAPSNGFSGQPINVGWTIVNKGTVPAVPIGTIDDRIYISQQNT